MSSTRRKFLGVSAAAAAAAVAGPARMAGQAATATATPTPSPTPGTEKKPSLLAQAARERYGKYLTEEQLPVLDERMAGLERTSARLRSFKFGNGEEPTTDFHALRSRGGAGKVSK
jgi:hypothetical protein